jgi:hypothetical protein
MKKTTLLIYRGRHSDSVHNDVTDQQNAHHWLVSVLLELHKSHPRHIFHLDITIGPLKVVSAVQVRHQRRRCDPHGVFTVDFVGDDIVGLQQRL